MDCPHDGAHGSAGAHGSTGYRERLCAINRSRSHRTFTGKPCVKAAAILKIVMATAAAAVAITIMKLV